MKYENLESSRAVKVLVFKVTNVTLDVTRQELKRRVRIINPGSEVGKKHLDCDRLILICFDCKAVCIVYVIIQKKPVITNFQVEINQWCTTYVECGSKYACRRRVPSDIYGVFCYKKKWKTN